MADKIQVHSFVDLVNSDLSDDHLKPTQARHMLNCNVLSTAEGNMGVVTNIKGNIKIEVILPEGRNKTIGYALDEEENRFLYAVWNSLGYHTWYQFDAVSETISAIMQCRRDTNDIDIFKWKEDDVILHTVIKKNNLLYWAMKGHPARKINIEKATQKDDNGYGTVILEDYTRAYKKTADFPPETRYVTDTNVQSNHVYRNLFKFAVRYIYDDGEISVASDFSRVPIPDQENTSGTLGVPLTNNCIKVSFLTGGMTVKKIELLMQRTNQDIGGLMDWVSIVVLDKDNQDIPDNSEYEYDFYNDNTYLPIFQDDVYMPHLYLPRNPECMADVGDTIAYANFEEGFDPIKTDIDYEVEYEELFVPDSTQDQLNNPFISINTIDEWYESGGFLREGFRHTTAEVVIGPDVKKGNIFTANIFNGSALDSTYSYEAQLTDTASTVANALANKFRTHNRMNAEVGGKSGWVDRVSVDGSGNAKFRFDIYNKRGVPHYHRFSWSVNPVNYSTLKNTGNSVLTNKLGSAHRYGIVYKDVDQVKSLTYGDIEAVYIKPLNELGDLKKAIIKLMIKHRAPDWAHSFEIVRTKNLVQENYIQILIQSKVTVTNVLGEVYTDLVIGSFNTYKQIHPNATISYDFKKGDRIRLLKLWDADNGSWSIPTQVIDYEVLEYKEITTETVNQNVIVDPDAGNVVKVDSPDVNNIGSYISIDGNERMITGITSEGYELSSPIATNRDGNTIHTFASFEIINSRGVLRIKLNPLYPIDVVAGETFALVEVYTPSQTFANEENENYYSIGYSFPVTQEEGLFLHSGNIQDQTETDPAIVQIAGYDNYVRNRELPISNDVKNPQVIFSSIEDKSFSDFYVSDISSYGKTSRLDDSVGVVNFGSRIRYSLKFIEDTRINGLSFFRNLNRVDYNDQYGDIKRLVSGEGRLYVFKYLKYAWAPIYGNVITDNNNTEIISSSSKLLPEKPEYFLFSAGVGDNPESVVRYGNDIFSVSPNSGYIINIGGNGALPVSKIFGMDKDIREIIANASRSGAKMFGAYDRKNGYYIVNVEGYDVIVFNSRITNENHVIVPIEEEGAWQVISGPSNGLLELTLTGYTYSPNLNYSGQDSITYRSGTGEVRTDVFDVLTVDTATAWRGVGLYCVMEGSARTGYVAISTLEEYDTQTGLATGVTKPNIDTDPDHIEPYEDLEMCSVGQEYVKLLTIDRSKNIQSIVFNIESSGLFNLKIIQGSEYSGTLLWESGEDSESGNFVANITQGTGVASLFIEVNNLDYTEVSEISISGAYVQSANFNDLTALELLVLNQENIPSSHNNQFTSLSIGQIAGLKTLTVRRHEMASIDLSSNSLLEFIDVQLGKNLVNLTIGDWTVLKRLYIQECAFTTSGYNPSFVNSAIINMDQLALAPEVLQYGPGPNSGIQPSSYVYPNYASLLSEAFVIGRAPQSTAESSLLLSTSAFQDHVEFTLTLSVALTVDISVNISGTITDVIGIVTVVNEFVDIFAGSGTASGQIYGSGNPVQSYDIEINSVTPNPAGGVTINY